MAVPVASIGSMDSFRPEEESWAAYIERFQCFVDCNQVEERRKVAMLLTVIGSKTYGLLRDLCTPRKPSELGFDEIVKTINEHLFPKPSFRAERFKFYRRLQASDESIAQYIAVLKKMAASCNFGTTLNDRLHDMLIGGVTSKSLRERLISDDTLTYEAAVKIANSMEAAQEDAPKITQDNQQQAQVQNVSKKKQKKPAYRKGKGKEQEASGSQSKMCWRCGYSNHKAEDCRFKAVRCNECQEEGHLRKRCPKKVYLVDKDYATEEEGSDEDNSDDSTLGENEVFRLVTEIISMLELYHQNAAVASPGGSQESYLAINHVRDNLIPPKNRKKMSGIWAKAVQFLDENESRVRREVQQVAGEEFHVWRWLPSNNPNISNVQAGNVGSKEPKVWQGQAFETMEGSVYSLSCSPTPCLKIRHMFDADVEFEDDWETKVQDAILEKCDDDVKILHIRVDRGSREGCVYMKCMSQEDAGKAYRALHGWWFDSKLVTVKYLRLERYRERFPDAPRCLTPLKPSNNQRLSMQGVPHASAQLAMSFGDKLSNLFKPITQMENKMIEEKEKI